MKTAGYQEKRILLQKAAFTVLMLFVYLLGRSLPLYQVDRLAYQDQAIDAENLLMQAIGGDRFRYSLFAIGISPYMIASIFVQVFAAAIKSDKRAAISPRILNWITIWSTMGLALLQAILHVREIEFICSQSELALVRVITVLEMVTGAAIIIWIIDRNKKYGIGGQTTLFLINIIDGIARTMINQKVHALLIPIAIGIMGIMITLILENGEKRIPVQRVSIHNIYADKNYLAIKLNPIGLMPIMFSTAFFMIPQMVLHGLHLLMPEHQGISECLEQMDLMHPMGIVIYLLILLSLTVIFSLVFINPRELSEQLLKSGDSIVDLPAGKPTERYIFRNVLLFSIFSACIMCMCIGIPLFLQFRGEMESSLVMLPSSMMILAGMWFNLREEVIAIRSYEAYKPFI